MNARLPVLLVLVCLSIVVRAAGDAGSVDVEMSSISGDVEKPRRHFRLRNPARIPAAEAERIYRIALQSMRTGYSEAGVDAIQGYDKWPRYNRSPYLSSTHGNHLVNNYANDIARNYGRFEKAGILPVGSIIAKDSFAVTRSGLILLGPVFLMEKMPAGFNYVSADWRYTMIRPDGRILGTTGGKNSDRVEYCAACHQFRAQQDQLYFIPKKFRAKNLP